VTKQASFGAGCFWGVEAAFRELDGVTRTRVGYSGGHTQDPTYEDVCSGSTGHAEVVEVTYDPGRISYDQLLATFWRKHNPTRGQRTGRDQYRSVIFAHDEEQRDAALRSMAHEQANHPLPIVTEIEPAPRFFEAEERHQRYLEKHGRASCTPALARAS
jgi:peptide-methionine (S)-S-oxide reductase